jgi:hypothetical protein
MRLWERYQERRRRKIREAHLQEKERQKALQDAQQSTGDIATRAAAANQGMYGQN